MGTLGRSTALAEVSAGSGGSGSGSGPARFEAGAEKTRIGDSSGTRVGSGGSGGELVRSFVELVKTVEAKVSVGMSFGDLDSCMSRLRGSESVGELECGLGDETKVVSIGSMTNSDANVGDEENGNCCEETKTDAAVNVGDEENGNCCDETKTDAAANDRVEENGNCCDETKTDAAANDRVEENGNCCDETKTDAGVNDGVEENGKCLDEIGGGLDVETEMVEVSIAGTSENGEDQVGEYGFCIGDFVWGKIKNHPWWPGQICDPSDASEHAAKLKSKDKLLVAYFGDDTFAWCHPSQLKPFEENFVENSKLSSSKVFVIAVQQAVDEIARRVKLKMSCSCMGEEFLSGCNQLLSLNAGVKEGIVVPEGRVGKFLGHLSQSVDLLAELKHVAQAASFTSVLELNVLKSLLSAFCFLKGGYQLPVYIEPQLIPGLEDERKIVEVPVQWQSDDRFFSPIGSNIGEAEQSLLQRSPPSIENRQPHKRKERTIADLLVEANSVEVKDMDGVIAKEEKQGLSSRRKQQKSEGILTCESGKERAKLSRSPISTKKAPSARRRKEYEGIGVDSTDGLAKESPGGNEETKKTPLSRRRKRDECSNGSLNGDTQEKPGGKDETKKATLSRRRKNKEDIHINNDDSKGKVGAKIEELPNVGVEIDMGNQIDEGPLLRERKISKYLSPPFTISDARKRKRNLETESANAATSHDLGKVGQERDMELVVSLELSNEAQFGERMTRAAVNLEGSPKVLNSCSEALQEKLSVEGKNNSTDVKTPAGEKKRVDPTKANAATNEVLSGVRSAAVDSSYPVKRRSAFETIVDFVSVYRDSVHRRGCNYKLYMKQQPHGKRKKSCSEPGSLVKDEQTAANLGNLGEGESGKRDRKKKQDKRRKLPTKKQAAETRGSKRRKLSSVIKSLGKDDENAENLPVDESGKRDSKKKQDRKSDKPAKNQAAEKQEWKSDKPTEKQAEAQSLKRRKLNSVIKSLGKEDENAENLPVNESGQRIIKNNQDTLKGNQVAEPPISNLVKRRSKRAEARDSKIKETKEEASPTFLFVTFGPGCSLPTKDDLLRIYSKFGELNETETDMFYTNFCARVAFVMSSDAEEAFNHSLIDSPFGLANVSIRIQNPPGASKTRELSAIPDSPPAKKSRGKTASKALVVSQPPAGESSQVDYIRHKLEKMSSMLKSSDPQVLPVATSKIQSEIKELLKVVSTMGDCSS